MPTTFDKMGILSSVSSDLNKSLWGFYFSSGIVKWKGFFPPFFISNKNYFPPSSFISKLNLEKF